ncbi:MAG TPA: LysM peptidoglycan-binding domain-containing protein [Sedimentisphaerales bacterium]|jgi:nucleoid-associated protein YgaU|nr:LysM peptidoglycan-binding domain-containing protein [Sedimentisphaerales bacterium]HNU30251.1 LysM peptidoglycan-binding domain-containing protein [Sedimentisphaerales bacterium]
MTSDAKIGLLLGLVFIFVIAFIINGLPNLKPQTTRAEVSMNMVPLTEENIGIAGRAQGHVDQDRARLIVDEEEPQRQTGPSLTRTDQAAPAVETPVEVAQETSYPEIRFESPLPRIENLLDRITAGLQSQREQTSTVNMDVPSPVQVAPSAGMETQPAVVMPQPKPRESDTRTAEPSKPAGTPATKPAGRVYVVGEGESLSTVAKKVYGPEEGNRIVNVNRIYEANKDILKSVNEVVAGQKLVIPALPQRVLDLNKPSDVLPQELFERLEPLKRRVVQTPATSDTGRWYTVQDGDNLWKIAASQLGAGARYEEIAKLNADLLKDKAVLDVGMKILLPTK